MSKYTWSRSWFFSASSMISACRSIGFTTRPRPTCAQMMVVFGWRMKSSFVCVAKIGTWPFLGKGRSMSVWISPCLLLCIQRTELHRHVAHLRMRPELLQRQAEQHRALDVVPHHRQVVADVRTFLDVVGQVDVGVVEQVFGHGTAYAGGDSHGLPG